MSSTKVKRKKESYIAKLKRQGKLTGKYFTKEHKT